MAFIDHYFPFANEIEDVLVNTDDPVRRREIVQYVRAHINNNSIDEIAGILHYNSDHINRIVKRKTGKTYTDFIHGIKLVVGKI